MIAIKVGIEERGDLKRLIRRCKTLHGAYVTVGVHEGAGSYSEGNPPPTVVEVALWHEFGTRFTPERSFLRAAINENIELINRWRIELVKRVLFEGWSAERALNALGFRMRELVRGFITGRHVKPPLQPSTVAAKKAAGVAPPDTPLYETGLLVRSIDYRVHT